MELANRLRFLRQQMGISQKEVAEHFSCAPGTISNYENGLHYPDPNMLVQLAEFYGVSTDYLLGHTQLRGKTVDLDQNLFGSCTVADLLWLQDHLPEKSQILLAHLIKLFKKEGETSL